MSSDAVQLKTVPDLTPSTSQFPKQPPPIVDDWEWDVIEWKSRALQLSYCPATGVLSGYDRDGKLASFVGLPDAVIPDWLRTKLESLEDPDPQRAAEKMFRVPSGEIDLLAMANAMPEAVFREYVELCRTNRYVHGLMRDVFPIIYGQPKRSANAS